MIQPAREIVSAAIAEAWQPASRVTVSAWAAEHRVLVGESSMEPGLWLNERTPYLVEPMDCLSEQSPVQKLVLEFGTQLGKNELGNNAMLYWMHQCPGPILFVQPSLDMMKVESQTRIQPTIEACEVLRGVVSEARSRDSANSMLFKKFKGGALVMTGANTSRGLRGRPARFVWLDEVDVYKGTVSGEGDPVALAEKRTSNFAAGRKVIITSSPTIKGFSRVDREFLRTDQRRYFVPCPYCDDMDWLRWERIRWEGRDAETAHCVCLKCGGRAVERHKTRMLARGEWRATATENSSPLIRGYHLSGLYSPLGWRTWRECVQEFIDSLEDEEKRIVWVNSVLGEPYEEKGSKVDAPLLKARAEQYPCEVPRGVGVLTCAVDGQGDRLEVLVCGWGEGEECWPVAWEALYGDPSQPEVWGKLHDFLQREYECASGGRARVKLCVIDSGGKEGHSEQVYRFCFGRAGVYPVKGGTAVGLPLTGRPSTTNAYKVKLYVLCTDTGKTTLYSRLRQETPGPGYVHLPDWMDDEAFEQLVSERLVRKWVKGKGVKREWMKTRERNEWLDLMVYSMAAFKILGPGVPKELRAWARALADAPPPPEPGEVAATQVVQLPRPPRKNWVNGWR